MTWLDHRRSNLSKSGISWCQTMAEATSKSRSSATNAIWTATKKWTRNKEKILRLNLVAIFMNQAQKVIYNPFWFRSKWQSVAKLRVKKLIPDILTRNCRKGVNLKIRSDNLNIENVFMGLVRNILVNMPLERPPDAAGDRGSTATLNLESKPLPAGGSCPC